jgi:hypothetical protein
VGSGVCGCRTMASTISEAKENYQCVFYPIERMMVSVTMPEPCAPCPCDLFGFRTSEVGWEANMLCATNVWDIPGFPRAYAASRGLISPSIFRRDLRLVSSRS